MVTIFYTNSIEFVPLARVTMPSFQQYSLRHNYHFCGRTTANPPHNVTRIEILLRLMENSAQNQFIWLVGCDVLVTNHEIRVEDFTDDKHNLFICKDVNGLNCDSFILRNCRWSRSWLKLVILLQAQSKNEQEAMQLLEDIPTFSVKTKYLPHPSINSYLYREYSYGDVPHNKGNWIPGDFVLHLPGLSNDRRIEIFESEEIKNSIIK